MNEEFDRQVENLIFRGYPQAAGLGEEDFRQMLRPLAQALRGLEVPKPDLDMGVLPFVIVIKSVLVPADRSMGLVEREGRGGITKLFPLEPHDFETVDDVRLPEGDAYLLVDIDRGRDTINITPNAAEEILEQQGRSPLTIDEGIAVTTHFPDFLMRNNCYSLLASRKAGDKRVPAIWLDGKDRPKLGWCWAGNPHTWLGSASCRERLGVEGLRLRQLPGR